MNTKSFITPFEGHRPVIADDAFVDISARLIGRVRIDQKASIWPGAVLRADDERIIVGQGSAVLDLCLLEAPSGHPVIVESGALISHKACLHGVTVKTGALIGIGAIVLDGAVIGIDAIIGAGALVPPGMKVPRGMLMLGQPAKSVRKIKPEEKHNLIVQLKDLETKAKFYRKQVIER